ncbi:MAG TPA: BrnT family toxin [Devosia sp.]
MSFEWDEDKRRKSRLKHGIDFTEVIHFDMDTAQHRIDGRQDYGETRYVSTGYLHGRLHVLCWTLREGRLRVISLRKANDREQKSYSDAS